MTFKVTALQGLPIYEEASGKKVGDLHDIIFNQDTFGILGIIVQEKGIIAAPRIVQWKDITAIGKDAVTIINEDVVIAVSEDEYMEEALKEQPVVRGTKVLTPENEEVGEINDMFLDTEQQKITGYEISGGWFKDKYEGRTFLPATERLKIGEDVVKLTTEQLSYLRDYEEGVKLQAERFKQWLEAKSAEYSETFKDQKQQAEVAYNEYLSKQTVESTLGQYANANVLLDNGAYLVHAGERINLHHIEVAKQHNKEKELVEVTVGDVNSAAKERLNMYAKTANEKISEGWKKLDQKSSEIGQKINEKADTIKEKAQEYLEEKRIERAVGRPVKRVILDHEDHVILNTGDIITYQAVEEAKKHDVLAVLLSSVDTKDPVIAEDQRKM